MWIIIMVEMAVILCGLATPYKGNGHGLWFTAWLRGLNSKPV